MTRTIFLQAAEIELREAVAYYESKSPGLGLDFHSEVETSVHAISRFPGRWPVREDGTSRCLIHRLPYVVVYLQQPGHVWIIAIAHCKRRPQYWAERT